jgi:hypothetical protein
VLRVLRLVGMRRGRHVVCLVCGVVARILHDPSPHRCDQKAARTYHGVT